MSGSATFFIKNHIPEEDLINLLNGQIPQGIESLELPNEKAVLFLQHIEYSEGFACSAGLAWGLDDFQLDDVSVARELAKELLTEVLFQPENLALPEGMEWCLAKPDGGIFAANIIELNDGIDVQPITLPVQLA